MPLPDPGADVVVVHPSRGGLVLSLLAGPSLLAVTGLGVRFGDAGWPLAVVALGALALTLVPMFDLPHRVEVGPAGVERVCLLRRQTLPWDGVVALQRGGTNRPRRRGGAPAAGQGLVAVAPGRRRYLLIDRVESHGEWAALRDAVRRHAPDTMFRVSEPPLTRPPTRPLLRGR